MMQLLFDLVQLGTIYKMGTQNIVNLLNDSNDDSSKFATKKQCIINDENNTEYCEGNENGSTIKSKAKVIESSLCDYSGAHIFVTGNVTATNGDTNTEVAF